jgi:hypothetical protein
MIWLIALSGWIVAMLAILVACTCYYFAVSTYQSWLEVYLNGKERKRIRPKRSHL